MSGQAALSEVSCSPKRPKEEPRIAPLRPSQIGLTPAFRRVKDGYKTALEELFEELFEPTHCGAMDLSENQTAFNRLVLSSNLRRPIF